MTVTKSEPVKNLSFEDLSEVIRRHLDFFLIAENNEKRSLALSEKNGIFHLIEGFLKVLYPSIDITTLIQVHWEHLGLMTVSVYDIAKKVLITQLKGQITPVPVMNEKHIGFEYNSDLAHISGQEDMGFLEEGKYLAACEDIAENFAEMPYAPLKIFFNREKYLTRQIPYWMLKTMLAAHALLVENNYYKLNDLGRIPFRYEYEDRSPISTQCQYIIDFNNEETQLGIILGYISKLNGIYDSLTTKLHKISIVKAKLIAGSTENPKILEYLTDLESLEKDLRIPFTSDLKNFNTSLTADREHILKSQQIPGTIDLQESTAALLDSKQLLDFFDRELKSQTLLLQQLTTKVDPILHTAETLMEKLGMAGGGQSGSGVLFKGKPFLLYAFDYNNLFNSFWQKFKGSGHIQINILDRIRQRHLPTKGNYKAIFFASKHLERHQKALPPNTQVEWHIEDKIKKVDERGLTIYCDVDTNLTAIIYNFIENYHSQIEGFYLGSGDKDLMIVAELAKKYGIPVFVIVVEASNLSKELHAIATDAFELY